MSEFVYIYVCILIIHDHFTSLSYQRRAFKGDNIYSDDDLDPTLVAHTKKTCHECSIHEMKTNGLYI